MIETSITFNGRTYLVIGEGRGATVRQIVPGAFRENDAPRPATLSLPVPHGSALWQAAVKQAAYERCRTPAAAAPTAP